MLNHMRCCLGLALAACVAFHAVAMAYKLLDAAQDRWRRIRATELVPLVRAGATFIDGQLQERSPEHDEDTDQVRAA